MFSSEWRNTFNAAIFNLDIPWKFIRLSIILWSTWPSESWQLSFCNYFLNQGWTRAYLMVHLSDGYLWRRSVIKSFASYEMLSQCSPRNSTGVFTMWWSIFLKLNGNLPDKSWNKMIPSDHISASIPCGSPYKISGAIYNFEPTIDFNILVFPCVFLLSPKSMILGSPFSIIMIFSGFKSLCTTPTEWIWPIPSKTLCMV